MLSTPEAPGWRLRESSAPGRSAVAEGGARGLHGREPFLPVSIKRMPQLAPLRQALREAGKYDELLSRLGIA